MKVTFLNGRSLALNAGQIAFIVIACLTLLNGFVDSLNYEFVDPSNWSRCTFLDFPPDAYADLVKASFVAPPFTAPDLSHWPPFMARYYVDNAYVRENPAHLVPGLSILHVTPVTLMMHILVKKLILAVSPQFAVEVFCIVALACLAWVCLALAPTRASALGAFAVLALSYPFLMIVNCGNMGALVNGVAVPLFFCFLLLRPNLWAAVACLTVAALFRPNILFLCPVLLGFGFWRAVAGSAVAAACLAAGYVLFFRVDAHFYPGYGLAAHLWGLKNYTRTYIVGDLGDPFNSSAFGAIKLLIRCVHGPDCTDIGGLLQRINLAVAAIFTGLLLLGSWLYLRGRLSLRAFAFVALACFALATTIFGAYHLLVFATFPLLFLHARPDEPLRPADRLILMTSVFVLVPKNYWFILGLSAETLLNPLMLGTTLVWLLAEALNNRLVSAAPAR